MHRLKPPVALPAALAAVSVLLLACGGGIEVAPPSPVVPGNGFGQASLDGVDRGPTQQVEAIVSGTRQRPVTVTGEVITFDATGLVQLAHRPLTASVLTLTGPGSPYTEGASRAACEAAPDCEYWIEDSNAGVLGRNGSPSALTPIPLGTPLSVTYEYAETLLTINVGIAYGTLGETISITVFNVEADPVVPFSTSVRSATSPADGSKAFDARLQTRLLEPAGRQDFGVVDLPTNRLDITGVDVTNTLNPCIQGHLVTAMTDSFNPDPANPQLLDVTFDDADCS